jgi:hypothetical protein
MTRYVPSGLKQWTFALGFYATGMLIALLFAGKGGAACLGGVGEAQVQLMKDCYAAWDATRSGFERLFWDTPFGWELIAVGLAVQTLLATRLVFRRSR